MRTKQRKGGELKLKVSSYCFKTHKRMSSQPQAIKQMISQLEHEIEVQARQSLRTQINLRQSLLKEIDRHWEDMLSLLQNEPPDESTPLPSPHTPSLKLPETWVALANQIVHMRCSTEGELAVLALKPHSPV